jgi:hypothetical protein
MEGRAFSCCTACSPVVVHEYRRQGWGMLQQAIGRPGYLEQLSGLEEMLQEAAGKLGDMGLKDAEARGAVSGSGDDDDWTEL